MNKNPFDRILDQDNDSCDENSLNEAVECYNPDEPMGLVNLLRSSDFANVLDGLYIFSEIGKRGKSLISEVSKFLLHPNLEARTLVASGYMSYIDDLSSREIKNIILNSDTSERILKEYVILIIAKIRLKVISDAVDSIEDINLRQNHLLGTELLEEHLSFGHLKNLKLEGKTTISCYFFAGLLKAAKRQGFSDIKNYKNNISEYQFISYILKNKLI